MNVMRVLLKYACFLGALCSTGNMTEARELSPLEVYHRCYIRMVRAVPPANDSNITKLQNGSLSAAQACINIFDKAAFSKAGVLKQRSSEESKKILKTFHDLHQSWFSAKTVYSSRRQNNVVRDLEEPALYYTRAAFLPDTPFKTIVTHNTGLAGVREQGAKSEKKFSAQRALKYGADYPYAHEGDFILAYYHTTWNGSALTQTLQATRLSDDDLVEVGRLVGVKPAKAIYLPPFSAFNPTSKNVVDYQKVREAKSKMLGNYNLNKHFGGGILGSQSFILNNNSVNVHALANEYDVINRRLTARIFEDIMCHQMPTLSDADVKAELVPNSKHTFQKSTSCMRCHSSMDGAALTYRNLFPYRTGPNPSASQEIGINVDGVEELLIDTTSTNFALQPPNGTLHYRELLTRKKIKKNVSSTANLGAQIASGNDIYNCAAKRYYAFFTGVNVSLNTYAENDVDKLHQNNVIELGEKLKSTQSVRSLLFEIFKSKTFQSSDYLTRGDQS